MAAWNRRPTLSTEEKNKEIRIDTMRKELIELVMKNNLASKGFDCRATFQKNTDNEMKIRRQRAAPNSIGWTYS